MLGRLARWLRVLGLDTAFDPTVPDVELVHRAQAEARILLTRDRPLITELQPHRVLLIASDAPLEQLREVATATGLTPPTELFQRCLVCNATLRAATPVELETLVPAPARALPGPVRRCPECHRIYWPGSHVRRMRAVLGGAFPEWFPG
jgi:uncharacterized protein with PIN domain